MTDFNKQKENTKNFFNALTKMFGEDSPASTTAKVILDNCMAAYDNTEKFKRGQTVYHVLTDTDGENYIREETLTGRTTLSEIDYFKDNLGTTVFTDKLQAEQALKTMGKATQTKDLFGITKGVFCQQVNCRGAIGGGLSGAINKVFPAVGERYMKVFEENHGISGRLFGGYDFVRVTDNLTVANIYSQDKYGNPEHTHEIYTDRKKLLNAVNYICDIFPNRNVFIPKEIGCGLGGENWEEIQDALYKLNKDNLYIVDTWTKALTKCQITLPPKAKAKNTIGREI